MTSVVLTRLILAADRASRRRALGMVAGIAVGVALALILLAASQALPMRTARSSWAALQLEQSQALTPETVLAGDQLAVASSVDVHDGAQITVMHVAQPDGGTTARIPGASAVPAPGEYLASPALAERIDSTPADQLGERYGTRVGTLAEEAIEGPDSLVVVVGADLPTVAATGGMVDPQVVTELNGTPFASISYQIAMIIGAIALLVPALVLVAVVTDLGAAQRAERFATLRLIGATPRQVAGAAAIEAAATTLLGTVAGVALYLASIPAAARITIASSRFFPADLLLSPLTITGAVLVATAAATLVAWWRTLRADVGPLGGTRERHETRPRLVGLLPLAIGVMGLATMGLVRDHAPRLAAPAILGSFVLTMLGLLAAGRVLTWWVGRLGQAGARSAAQVIGFARITQHPRAVFRTVSGLVAALYAVTVFAVAITAAAGTHSVESSGGRLAPTAIAAFPTNPDPAVAAEVAQRVSAIPGVRRVVQATLTEPARSPDGSFKPGDFGSLVLEADDAQALGAPTAPKGARSVSINALWVFTGEPARPTAVTGPTPEGLPAFIIDVAPGNQEAAERARTLLFTSDLHLSSAPMSRLDRSVVEAGAVENQFATMGYIGILIATGISAVCMGVSTIAALVSRKRVLVLLKLTGMPTRTVRSIIGYETWAPVIVVVALSIGLGALTGWGIVSGLSARSVEWPEPMYYVVLAISLVLVAASVLGATRAARRMLQGTTVRFE
ncbi:FtsX-like permease family protein [Actinomyces slackii]|uniref:FtsX-like permease family n=1 Tax=Actinomyces slackii TaxID=52774 RepID=A0A448K966_9ACTO|nr:FtsX-like permease family protein [Actinomyces slackii]VEG73509.1 FtsX-like permease family [Actinomyces slackii]